jgi:hypothetical protein
MPDMPEVSGVPTYSGTGTVKFKKEITCGPTPAELLHLCPEAFDFRTRKQGA